MYYKRNRIAYILATEESELQWTTIMQVEDYIYLLYNYRCILNGVTLVSNETLLHLHV